MGSQKQLSSFYWNSISVHKLTQTSHSLRKKEKREFWGEIRVPGETRAEASLGTLGRHCCRPWENKQNHYGKLNLEEMGNRKECEKWSLVCERVPWRRRENQQFWKPWRKKRSEASWVTLQIVCKGLNGCEEPLHLFEFITNWSSTILSWGFSFLFFSVSFFSFFSFCFFRNKHLLSDIYKSH